MLRTNLFHKIITHAKSLRRSCWLHAFECVNPVCRNIRIHHYWGIFIDNDYHYCLFTLYFVVFYHVAVTRRLVCQRTSTYENASSKLNTRFVYVKSTLRYISISNKNVCIAKDTVRLELKTVRLSSYTSKYTLM